MLIVNCLNSFRTAPTLCVLESQRGQSILIRLTEGFLYCADDGTPIDEDGVAGLMFDRMSSKRNTAAIGRFGRGFKSVLRVTDAPRVLQPFRFFPFRQEAHGEAHSRGRVCRSLPRAASTRTHQSRRRKENG